MVVLLCLTALMLLVVDGRGSPVLDGGRSLAAQAARPIETTVAWVGDPIGGVVDSVSGDLDHYREENDELRAELAELRGQLDQAANNEAELADLRKVAGLEVADSLPTVVARVTADRTTPTDRTLEIDQGSAAGVAVGQSVITGEGLVGQIIAVAESSATVRPVTDSRIVIGVTSPVTGAVGVAEGRGVGRRMELNLVERDREVVQSGASFITSGFDRSLFPPGIAVGTYQLDSGGHLTLVPAADLERPGFITVVLTEPRDAG